MRSGGGLDFALTVILEMFAILTNLEKQLVMLARGNAGVIYAVLFGV